MTNTKTRPIEPECCFCGVRLGLRLAHLISAIVVFGMMTIVNLIEADGIIVVMGTIFILSSCIGILVTFIKDPKLIWKGVYVYYTMYVAGLILLVVVWIQIGEKEYAKLAELKAKNPNMSNSDLESLKSAYKTSIIVTIVYQTLIPFLFFIGVLNRTNAYRCWVEKIKNLKLAVQSTNVSMSEMNLISLSDSKTLDEPEMDPEVELSSK